jgi:uncharacterized protein (DUF58 family)
MFTGTGRAALATTSVLVAAAAFTAYSQVVALAGVSAVAIVTALVSVRPPRLEVTCTWKQPRTVEGERAELRLQARNPSGRRAAPCRLTPQFAPGAAAPARTGLTITVPSLRPGQDHEDVIEIDDLGRGCHTVERVLAERCDALGLVRRSSSNDVAASVIIRPQTVSVTIPGRRLGRGDEGDTTDLGLRDGNTFHSLREYQPGDDTRLIHWPSTARTGTMMLRDVVTPEIQRHVVVLDVDARYYGDGQFEEAVRIAASIAAALSRRHIVWLFTTGGDHVSVRPRHTAGVGLLLDLMAMARLDTPAARSGPRDVAGAVVTVVTGDLPPKVAGKLAPQPFRWRRFDSAVLMNIVQVSSLPAEQEERRDGGLRIRTRSLQDFSVRWNSWWRR